MSENLNSIKDLMNYFGTPERPVTPGEFKAFWESLSDAEKIWYKNQPLN